MAELLNKIPTNLTEYPNSFKRQGAFPLEAYSVFYATETKTALEAAQDYATNNGIAYVGQTLAVVDVNNENVETVTLYIISDAAGSLQEVGRATEGDNVSIALDDGVLSLAGFAAAGNATLPQKTPVYRTDAEGNPTDVVDHYELTWKSLDAIVDGDTNELAGLIQTNATNIQSLSEEFDALESVLNSVIENNDGTALDSIKELATWIEQHGQEASKMTTSITANTNAIAVLNGTGEGSVKHIVDTAVVNIPAATTNTLGLVKVGNTLTVSNDGFLDVDSITTDQLTQGSNTLVLNGGSATQN